MPVYKDDNGRGSWYVRVYVQQWDGTSKQTTKRGFKTKREALAWEAEAKAKRVTPLKMTFKSLWKEYVAYRAPRSKDSSLETARTLVETYVMPYFETVPIDAIDVKKIQEWQTAMLNATKEDGTPYSKTYLRSIQSRFSAALNYAVKTYGLHQNPIPLAGPLGTKQGRPREFWTLEEFKKAIATLNPKKADDVRYRVLFKIAFFAGLRRGEILALRLEDFHPSGSGTPRPVIKVTRSWGKVGGEFQATTPKTKSSIREVAISDTLYREVIDYTEHLYHYDPADRLFDLSPTALNYKLKTLIKRAGVKQITFHGLRHSCASLYINNGADVKQIQALLGHADIRETLNTYGHLYESRQHDIIDLVDDNI